MKLSEHRATQAPGHPRGRLRAGVLAWACVALFAGLGVLTGMIHPAGLTLAARAETQPSPVDLAAALGDAFAEVIDQVRPAIVTITSERVVSGGPLQGNRFPEFFERFFGPFNQNPNREFRQYGLGSGFIVASDGLVLTANHVVADAKEIKVRLADDRELEAEVVGTDPKTDVAVLRIKSQEAFPSLRLGDSDRLRVGQWVLALGTPFAERLRETVTAGIVSAKGRSRIGLADYEDFIQTDAAINRGNSGGPLVNIHAEVVGINTAIASGTGGYQGVGFAVPINMARTVMESILTEGRVVRGWMGIYIGDLTDSLREAFKVDVREGILVQQVVEDGPGAKAGLRDGDVITEMDGAPVGNIDEFRFRVAQMRPGRDVRLTVIREGRAREFGVRLGELPANEEVAQSRTDRLEELGLRVSTLSDEVREELDLDPEIAGIVIADVDENSPAADEGLRPGDVIVEVDRVAIDSVADLTRAVDVAEPGEVLLLTVVTRSARRFVALRIPE